MKKDTPKFRFIDLFAGIGGFRSALTALGGECVFTSEWDRYALKTYKEWYGDDNIYEGDIRELGKNVIPNHEILCAGFPCQPFSLAGVSKKNSLGRAHGFEDVKQGNLFFSILEIVDEKRPPILFLENVKNLKSHDKGQTWGRIYKELSKRGYAVFEKIIDAREWVPQHRERIFLVCFDEKAFGLKEQIEFTFPEKRNNRPITLSKILEKNVDPKYMLSDKLFNYLVQYRKKHEKLGNGFGYSEFDGSGVARTLSARYHKDGSEILITQKGFRNPRRLTPGEAKSLMGFDDRYAELFGHKKGYPIVVSDTQAYRQFGNSVVPLLIEAIGREVLQILGTTKHSKKYKTIKTKSGRFSRPSYKGQP